MNQPEKTEFLIRIVTISYTKMFGPNCSDLEGLHESILPFTSISELHRKETGGYNLTAVFRPINKSEKPIFVFGSIALGERDKVTQPKVKRCYFVGLFAVVLKRDIIQNPLPPMIDRVLEIAENTYKLFEHPKYHTDHVLKDVTLLNRIFDFRDCASELVSLQDGKKGAENNFSISVKKQLKRFFKKSTSGIIHFSNCCYGFWFSEAMCRYYYLDPYQCDDSGRRVAVCGQSCLCIFSSVYDMARQMCVNQSKETTGFFIHRIHVESVNSLPRNGTFQEDPIWIYLDYHWSHRHSVKPKTHKNKIKKKQIALEEAQKPSWKNYLVVMPNYIYSVWGTVGCFDQKFGSRAGKNQAAIGVAVIAMRNLCHPSDWSAVVLDSAVIYGDYYYKESKKVSTRCLNRFNLAEGLKVLPYRWKIEFTSDICGVLYSSGEQPNLADSIVNALNRSPNLLLQCKQKIVAILQTTDAFYAVDSSWTGPPLFLKNRGAIYAIRCKNMNMLIYVLTKMLNTNQRLEFTITPLKIILKQEGCQSSGDKPKVNRKRIFEKTLYSAPGQTVDHPSLVCGSVVVTDEDYYLCYSRNLKFGLFYDAECEKQPEQTIDCSKETARAFTGKKSKRKSPEGVCSPKVKPKSVGSISDNWDRNIGYPQVLDLGEIAAKRAMKEPGVCQAEREFKCGKYVANIGNVECEKRKFHRMRDDIKSSFIYPDLREVFQKYMIGMQKEVYKNYKHFGVNKYKQDNSIHEELVMIDEKKSSVVEEHVDEMENDEDKDE